MTLKRLLLAAAFALAASALPVAAQALGTQGSRPMAPIPLPPPLLTVTPSPTSEKETPYVSTRSFSGEVREVNLNEGYIVVFDSKRGEGTFYVGDKTRLRADKKTPLGDRKNLTLEDFQKGQTVKVTFWPKSLQATELRVRQPKS